MACRCWPLCCCLQVGLWAQRHLPSMSLPALQAFSDVLDVDNPDLFKWLTGQLPADAGIAKNNAAIVINTAYCRGMLFPIVLITPFGVRRLAAAFSKRLALSIDLLSVLKCDGKPSHSIAYHAERDEY